ncbi:autotransporter outer membrane beta-barrel domain-containing protein [Bartonella tribocorum]|uniref:Inducible Bartonella autotransporter C protein n=1 Tax=Bartonella tribocorum (strain DSM 28219 / CCUG 45778 / CIP 105476 / IBS 506) TaxID=382640 RepID=A9IWK3_BART1|nr:autotransporter outer membrane beta-barrel domain-containing protein [Bartonella tribocorum]CAK01989.1 inducible Bartonella autotransporter C protein [Bartonella tribocorum CIP 105476]CDO49249.1 inducible autotransporter C [Bartonella tribocorum]
MCKKYIYKKNFLLCTIAGTFIFSYFAPTYANTQPPEIPTVQVANGEEKGLNNVFVRGKYDAAVAKKGHITITNSIMRSDFTLLSATSGGQINAKGIVGTAKERGLSLTNGIIHVEDSIINVIGHSKVYGINFGYILSSTIKEGEEVVNKAILNNTKLLVKDGVGIFGPYYSKAVANAVSLKNSEIRSDMLLKNEGSPFTTIGPTTFTLDADNSIMEGRAKTLPQNTTVFTLNNNSKWHLKISLFELENSFSIFDYKLLDLKQRAQSVVSVLNLNNSSIIFDAPHELVHGHYQTLHVGKYPQKEEQNRSSNATAVYNATGNARIYFNTEWSDGLKKEQQKTDRVLVHGDVSGITTIYFNNLSKRVSSNEESKEKKSIPLNVRGLSLIQVSGQANEDSFKLSHGYTTLGGLPYKYILNGYGPTSSRGKADRAQSHLSGISQESQQKDVQNTNASSPGKENNRQAPLEENENFWDFRLQSATLDEEGKIKALVPQMASYLVMSNALFSSGLSDVSNQNTQLDNMHSTVFGLEGHKKKGIFLSTYGNKVTLSSSRSPLEYGYGADVRYAALQAGITLATLENQNITANFGLLGTYGKLSFTPKDMDGSDKSTLDKWSLTTYGNLHHDNGLYINALFSYGIFNGHITTALIDNTTELKDTDTLNISATVGQKLATGVEGLAFEPQAQLIYQHIAFGTLSDVDGFHVNIKPSHQWLVRIGGRLTKTMLPIENDRVLSFYGKLNIIKAFSEKNTIDIVESFHLDSMGSSLEGGLGINAQLSKNIALHADVNYQHKLQRAGFSGVNISGGVRYRF